MGKQCKQWQTLFWGAPTPLQMVTAVMKLKDTCSLEGKLWKPRQCIKKQRQYCTLTKIHRVKIMVFPLVMNRCESWTIKAKHQRIYACELWCRRRLLRIPWTARRSKLSILKEINPEYSLERQILKLKLQYFGYLMGRANSLEETLMLGKIDDEDDRGWNGWMASLTQCTRVWANPRR